MADRGSSRKSRGEERIGERSKTMELEQSAELERSGELVKLGTLASSHAVTVLQECFKDDNESQWKSGKFDPRSPRNP